MQLSGGPAGPVNLKCTRGNALRVKKNSNSRRGFTLLEIIIYIAILSLVLLLVSSFMLYFTKSNSQTKNDREILENTKRALEIITYEINGAKGIYTPTTSANQLSLETSRYLPTNENTNYIDFFMCGVRICMKKESQNPIFLTSETVEVSNFTFTQISINGNISIKINVTAQPANAFQPSVTLISTASLRSY